MPEPIASEKKVTLWTRQDIRSLEDLKKEGAVRIKRKHLVEKFDLIADYIIDLYSWFVNAANKIIPKPEGVEFPIWCSISEEYMLRPTDTEIVYVLEVDESEILYFDGCKWDYVLNHHYVPKDDMDMEEYERDISVKGFRDSYSFLDKNTSHFYPEERKRVIDSWIRVFDTDKWDPFRIQANIWEIRPDMIKGTMAQASLQFGSDRCQAPNLICYCDEDDNCSKRNTAAIYCSDICCYFGVLAA